MNIIKETEHEIDVDALSTRPKKVRKVMRVRLENVNVIEQEDGSTITEKTYSDVYMTKKELIAFKAAQI